MTRLWLWVFTAPALKTISRLAINFKAPLLVDNKTPVALFVSSKRIRFAKVWVYTFRLGLSFAACRKLDSLELRSSFGDDTVSGEYCAPIRSPELKSRAGEIPIDAKASEA